MIGGLGLMVMVMGSPWQVGPAPSAHPTVEGFGLGVDVGGSVGGPEPLRGARITAEVTPHARIWTSLELAAGQGWRTCIDCRALAGTWTARGLWIERRAISIATWSVLTSAHGAFEWTPGVALEAGSRRLRVDTSWPVWSTWDLLTLLRITPELGLTWAWSARQATRAALVGLEPTVAVTHRVLLPRWMLEVTARYGEEGFGLMVGASVWGSIHRRRPRRW